MSATIKQVSCLGDLVEIIIINNGEERTIRRNVQGYTSMNLGEQKLVIADIVGDSQVVYSNQPKLTLLQRVRKLFRK